MLPQDALATSAALFKNSLFNSLSLRFNALRIRACETKSNEIRLNGTRGELEQTSQNSVIPVTGEWLTVSWTYPILSKSL